MTALGTPGGRGGSIPTLSVREADELFNSWRPMEYGWLRARIIALAARHGEYHADMLAGVEITEPNQVGAAVQALARMDILEKLNRDGDVEHRTGTSDAAHGRQSYVWRLTPKGRVLGDRWREERGDKLPSAHKIATPEWWPTDLPDPTAPTKVSAFVAPVDVIRPGTCSTTSRHEHAFWRCPEMDVHYWVCGICHPPPYPDEFDMRTLGGDVVAVALQWKGGTPIPRPRKGHTSRAYG